MTKVKIKMKVQVRSALLSVPPLLAVLAILVVVPASALAATAHRFEKAFGSPGEGAGQLDLVAPIRGAEGNPEAKVAGSGVAVDDATHDVYVADTGNRRVGEFDSAGTFIRAFGGEVGPHGEGTCTTALTCKAGASGSAAGDLSAPKFVAVDNSGGTSEGDVYVGDGVGKEAANELQGLSFPTATGGTYTLTFNYKGTEETTGPIAYTNICTGRCLTEKKGEDAEAASKALEELTKIGHGNVTVSEKENSGIVTGLQIEFIGALAETAVPALSCDSSRLTPEGASCQVNVEREGSKFAGEVVSKFNPEGKLEESWGVKGQLDGSGVEDGPFAGELGGLAVDSAGDLWVLSTGGAFQDDYIYEFEENGTYKGPTQQVVGGASASGLAVAGAGNLYVAKACVEKLGAGCVSDAQERDPSGFAFDEGFGEVYADLGSSIESAEPACVADDSCGVFGSSRLAGGELDAGAGVAVDQSSGEPSSGVVYVADTGKDKVDAFPLALTATTGAAGEVTGTTATLSGEVNPVGTEITRCTFQYGTSEGYGQTAPCLTESGSEVVGAGGAGVEVHADLAGLAGQTAYHFRLHVVDKDGEQVYSEDGVFTTLAAAVIEAATTSGVEESSAVFMARVNPEGVAGTSCEFEYGTSTGYGTSVPCEHAAAFSGAVGVPVELHVAGLAAGTTYHWRVVVSDANATGANAVTGMDNTFVYLAGGIPAGVERGCANEAARGESSVDPGTGLPVSESLPDCRGYELVTPAQKNGALLAAVFADPKTLVGSGGSRVIAYSLQCFAGAQSCTGSRGGLYGVPFEFSRGEAGWATHSLTGSAGVYSSSGLWGASPETGRALYSGLASGRVSDEFYATEAGGALEAIGPVSEERPFSEGLSTRLLATADLSHVVYLRPEPGEWPSLSASEPLYEYAGSGNTKPFLVDVTGGEHSTQVIPASCEQIAEFGGITTSAEREALSVEGGTVYFGVCGDLYARIDGETAAAHTVLVSARSATECGGECAGSPAAAAELEGVSENGSRAFFTSTQQLTDTASEDETPGDTAKTPTGCRKTTGPGGCNLYESVCPEPCGSHAEEPAAADRSLIDVSAGDTSGEGPRVQGVMAVSGDGSHVYFVAKGVLAGANSEGKKPTEGADNLYVYDGHTSFIATLPGIGKAVGKEESETPETDQWEVRDSQVAADVSGDGEFLVFTSHGALTGDAARGLGPEQVYRYDAVSGRLLRVSVGERGFDDDGNAGAGNARIAALSNGRVGQPRRDASMSEDGQIVFFQSPVGLTPGSLNDVPFNARGESKDLAQNVYEWEAQGEHGCGEAAGCVFLISDGRDASESGGSGGATESSVELVGTDATGENVFFTTADRLVGQDSNSQLDIYDARVDGGFPAPQVPAACASSETCHEAGTSPGAEPSLGSQVFTGPGNLAPLSVKPTVPKPKTAAELRAEKLAKALKLCRKVPESKRSKCEQTARKKYSPIKKAKPKKKKTSHKGRA